MLVPRSFSVALEMTFLRKIALRRAASAWDLGTRLCVIVNWSRQNVKLAIVVKEEMNMSRVKTL